MVYTRAACISLLHSESRVSMRSGWFRSSQGWGISSPGTRLEARLEPFNRSWLAGLLSFPPATNARSEARCFCCGCLRGVMKANAVCIAIASKSRGLHQVLIHATALTFASATLNLRLCTANTSSCRKDQSALPWPDQAACFSTCCHIIIREDGDLRFPKNEK